MSVPPSTLWALTGTPGTGKTSIARLLRNATVVSDRQLAEAGGAVVAHDGARGADVIDEDQLAAIAREHLPEEGIVVVEGLLAHHVGPDATIVLRCHPDVLRERLAARGWSAAKVEENVMAEVLDATSHEVASPQAWSLDTTRTDAATCAALIDRLLTGDAVAADVLGPLGAFDWTDVLLREDGA